MRPRYLFIGDWPAGMPTGTGGNPTIAADRGESGVRYADELCPSCNGPITTTGECRCSD